MTRLISLSPFWCLLCITAALQSFCEASFLALCVWLSTLLKVFDLACLISTSVFVISTFAFSVAFHSKTSSFEPINQEEEWTNVWKWCMLHVYNIHEDTKWFRIRVVSRTIFELFWAEKTHVAASSNNVKRNLFIFSFYLFYN